MAEEMTPEERLKAIDEEKKKLKEQLSQQKEKKKVARNDFKAKRDGDLEKMDEVLGNVQKEIYAYNHLGKDAKMKSGILDMIKSIVTQAMLV